MDKFESASIIAGVNPNAESQASAPTNLHLITGEVVGRSEDGTALVEMEGIVFSGDDSQYVPLDTVGGLEEGDTANILLVGESGQAMAPFAIGSVGSMDRVRDTADHAMTVGDPNLTPFFSHDFSDYGTDQSGAYWTNDQEVLDMLGRAQKLSDGWARFYNPEFSVIQDGLAVRVNLSQISVVPGDMYTLLVEVGQVDAVPESAEFTLLADSDQNRQLYGDLESHEITEGAIYRIDLTAGLEPTESMLFWIVKGSQGGPVEGELDFSLRLSLYKGFYYGNYKPVSVNSEQLQEVEEKATSAKILAEAADKVAKATGQYFWHNTGEEEDPIEADISGGSGAHVTEFKREEWSDPESEHYHSGANSLWNSHGMLFREGTRNLLALVTEQRPGVVIYDGQANAAENVVASFSSKGVEIGKMDSRALLLSEESFIGRDGVGTEYVNISQNGAQSQSKARYTFKPYEYEPFETQSTFVLGYDEYDLSHMISGSTGIASSSSFIVPLKFADTQVYEVIFYGPGTFTYFESYPAERRIDFYIRPLKFTFEEGTSSLLRNYAVFLINDEIRVEVSCNFVYDADANKVYVSVEVPKEYSSCFSIDKTSSVIRYASAKLSVPVIAYAPSYQLGDSMSSGSYAVSFGKGTVASQDTQMVLGAYNVEDATGAHALIIGNGTSEDDRSNLFTVGWDGRVTIYNSGADTASTSAPSRSQYWTYAKFDKNGRYAAYWQTVQDTNNLLRSRFAIRRVINGSDVNHGFDLGIDSSGNRTVTVHDQTAWLKAFGLTTTTTSTISQIAKAAANITINSAQYAQNGKTAILYMRFTTTVARGTGNWIVGTMVAGKHPVIEAGGVCGTAQHQCFINSSGTIYYNNTVTSSVAANTSLYVKVTFILP